MRSQLVVSLSGIGTRTMDRCAELAAELDRRHIPLSLLVAPRELGRADCWVRERTGHGDALVLHGVGNRRLPAHEAGLLLTGARAAMETLGLEADCFAPKHSVASPGTLVALRRHRFSLCADATAVRDLRTGTSQAGRVHALGERVESLRCFALVHSTARAARRGGLVRINVDAAELDRSGPRSAVLDAVDVAMFHDAEPTTYVRLPSPRRASAA